MTSGLKEAVIELREEDALRITEEELKGGADPLDIVTACREAMDVIGKRFADGEAFIPELIMAGEIMTGITAKVKPYLKSETTGEKLGTVVIAPCRATSTTSARTSSSRCSTSPASTSSIWAWTCRSPRSSRRCARARRRCSG